MKQFNKWFAESKVASYLRSFVAVVVAQAVTEFQRVGYFDFAKFESWIIAALVATLPTFLRTINPQDQLR